MNKKNLILSLLGASLLWTFPASAALHSGIYIGSTAGGSIMRSKLMEKWNMIAVLYLHWP